VIISTVDTVLVQYLGVEGDGMDVRKRYMICTGTILAYNENENKRYISINISSECPPFRTIPSNPQDSIGPAFLICSLFPS
jgi:hypothetical protein